MPCRGMRYIVRLPVVSGWGSVPEVWRAVRAKPLKKLSLFPRREEGRVMGSFANMAVSLWNH